MQLFVPIAPAPPVRLDGRGRRVPEDIFYFCVWCGMDRSNRGLLFDDHTLAQHLRDAHGRDFIEHRVRDLLEVFRSM